MYYYSFYRDNDSDFIYTVDMIRLSIHIRKKDVSSILFLLNSKCKESWDDDRYGHYSQNFKFENLWFGVGTKTKKDSEFVLFSCEFNPNKLSKESWEIFYFFDKLFYHKWIVRRFDLAIDVPYNINDLDFYVLNKKSYSVFFKDFNDKTFYYGKGSGRLKVYNKAIESALDSELTRFEITMECNFPIDYPNIIDFNFPQIALKKFISSDKSDTLDCIQYALNNGFPFSSLSRTYKSFFKKDLLIHGKLRSDLANKALHNFFVRLNTPLF